jgi:hypothetical protein
MSAATDFLSAWIAKAAIRLPSMTRVTCQGWPGVGQPWKPGIASYGWAINGMILNDPSGNPYGLRFGDVYVWFSDRGQDVSNPPPSGQQFNETQYDMEDTSLTLFGDAVLLTQIFVTQGANWQATTTILDDPSQQLIFSVPGAGPNAPQALMLISFADTGQFGWL